jgi:uncharacterized membrane protein
VSVGYLEESEGVKSTARLSIVWLLVLVSIVIGTLAGYVFIAKEKTNDEVVGAFGVVLGALVWHGVVSIKNRNVPDEPK